jgi:phosphoribosyl 1,2-cyclic phosphodiesterase
MDITFFGVRGSTPVSGNDYAEFGGSTTSLEISTPHCQIIFDTGSGFRNIKLREDVPVFIIMTIFRVLLSIRTCLPVGRIFMSVLH